MSKPNLVVATLPGKGKFLWWPATQVVSFVPLGRQRALKEWCLTSAQNSLDGARAKVGRILAWESVD